MNRALLATLALLLGSTGLSAETLERQYQAVMHVRKVETIPVFGASDHVVGIAAFRGLAVFDDEEVVLHRYEGQFDIRDGSGPFEGYALWRFDDGSEITATYKGEAHEVSANDFEVSATFHDLRGTGRFDGAVGGGAFSGRRIDPIDQGGSTYLRGTLTLTLPDVTPAAPAAPSQ
ncbi:hypothetical protein [Acuticoccus kandeliae]|uniref:hypothetical protein n=1 Tax=Acuticoccus kandeliae TaxID=2073160 RepID=UPI000D3E783D|nr:hypothetical protein [Acuticoccus kandeliae]